MTRTRLAIIIGICAVVVIILIVGAVASSGNKDDDDGIFQDEQTELSSSASNMLNNSSSSSSTAENSSDQSSGSSNDETSKSDDNQTQADSENTESNNEENSAEEISPDAAKLIELLKIHPFIGVDGKSYLVFTDNEVIGEVYGGNRNKANYSIKDVSVETMTADDDITLDRYKATITINDKDYELTSDTASDGTLGNLMCSAFTKDTAWIAKTTTDDISVGDLVEGTNSFVDGKNDEAKACVINYCQHYVPTTTQATPLETATVDYANNAVTIYYSLAPIGGDLLEVTYDKNNGSFNASRG